jgi:hypothetical protein
MFLLFQAYSHKVTERDADDMRQQLEVFFRTINLCTQYANDMRQQT